MFIKKYTVDLMDLGLHYHLQVQANPKKCTKKLILILASMGKSGLSHDIFLKFSLRPFEVVLELYRKIEQKWELREILFWSYFYENFKLL